jgi:lysozyme
VPGVEERVDAIEERYDGRVERIRERARREIARLRADEKQKIAAVRRGATELSEDGAAFIASWEGFRALAYQDVVGVWTIGYGHTAGVRPGQTVTRAEALKLLMQDASIAEAAVRSGVAVRLNQHQFDALVSFVFNVGTGAFQGSTLRAVLNAGRYGAVPGELMRWVNAGSHPVQGLVNRRRAEADLFMK